MTSADKEKTFDPIWEDIYSNGPAARCPYDFVASFAFRNSKIQADKSKVRVLEVGCGSGNNIWFLALEGFDATGLDGSAAAIQTANARVEKSGAKARFDVGDFTKLPYEACSFDMVIDRGALTCVGDTAVKTAVSEIHRVLKPGGHFLFNPIGDTDSSFRTAEEGPDGVSINIKDGDFSNVGQIRFFSRRDINTFIPVAEWDIEKLERVEIQDMSNPGGKTVSSWRVECKKKTT